ncbi:MAG: ribosome maturation factor RimP [Proteobacteria bacterium]|nr:ribosome maturation factor RimP [Pseudomonadota bacterium]
MVSERETIEKIERILTPILEEDCLELIDIEFRPSGKRWLLRIYIEKDGGVTISDCAKVNREFGRTLEIEDIIEHPYTLEVSSPGLTRPLKNINDFKRYVGKQCRIITSKPLQERNEFSGEIIHVTEDEVELKGKIDVFTIPICDIKKAHLDFGI